MSLSKQDKVLIGVVTGVMAIGVVYSILKWLRSRDKVNTVKKTKSILLGGGLDDTYKSSYKSLMSQVDLVNEGVADTTIPVTGFSYKKSDELADHIRDSKEPMFVMLFSKSGEYSDKIAQTMKEKGYPLDNLYVVEPYAGSTSANSRTTSNVRKAIELGMPPANVYAGRTYSTGKGITTGATPTPSCTPSHWCALIEVGKIIKSKTK
jgi:hypothetical protein